MEAVEYEGCSRGGLAARFFAGTESCQQVEVDSQQLQNLMEETKDVLGQYMREHQINYETKNEKELQTYERLRP